MNSTNLARCASVAVLTVLGCCGAGLASADVSGRDPGCGQTINRSTVLHRDIVGCAHDGLVVGADNITLDLGGHTISGDGLPNADGFDIGIRVEGHHHVSVVNGAVQRFDRGVVLTRSPNGFVVAMLARANSNRGIVIEDGSHDGRVLRSSSTDNGAAGIAVVNSEAVVLKANRSLRNPGGPGIRLTGAGRGVVMGNEVSADGDGIGLDDNSNGNLISGNSIADVEQGIGINFSVDNVVTHNRMLRTGGGITIESADNTRITDNTVLHSNPAACDGCGIGIQIYGNNNLVADNTVIDSPRYGIEVDDFQDPGHSPVTGTVIRDNRVRQSGLGIAIGPEAGGVVLETVISGNIVSDARGDGIQLIGPSTGLQTSRLTDNLVLRNGGYGIDALAGTGDGGGDRAAHNANPVQCLNIICSERS